MINKYKKIAKLILMTLILFTGCIVGYGYNIRNIKDAKYSSIYQLKVEEFNKIYLYMTMCKNQAEEDIDDLSTKIEYEIRSEYPDLSVLKEQLSKDDYSSVYPIFKDNVKDKFFGGVENGNNDIFVATLTNIIVDFSYNNNTNFSSEKDVKARSWEYVINSSYNKELAQYAKDQIINKSRDLIILERSTAQSSNHKMITNPTYENLLSVYLKEGIEGLKGYTVLVPAYITDTADIFDTEDFQSGVRVKNYKFIIIQEFNIYDQIKENYTELFDDNSINEKIKSDNKVVNYVYILGLALIASYTITIVLLMSVFNIILVEMNKEKEDKL